MKYNCFKTCRVCGQEFGTNWAGARYCSHAHRQEAYRQRHAVETSHSYCRWCGVKFYPERGGALYHSAACKQAAYRARKKAGGQLMF